MDNNLINNILTESMSKDHLTVIQNLSEPKQDEELASGLKIKETIVRTILNDLHAEGLVSYQRSKNKKTGWYTYMWEKRDSKISDYIQDYLQNKLSSLEDDLTMEKNGSVFACSCSRVSFQEAFDNNFLCPHCNQSFKSLDNAEKVRELEAEVERINALVTG